MRTYGDSEKPAAGRSLLLICLAITILPSCSQQQEAAGNEGKPAVKAAPQMPSGAMPLSAALQTMERAGYAPVVEVEFEKDHWKMKAYSNGQLLELKVDPITGSLIPNAPPKIEKPLSVIVKSLENQGYGPFVDVEHGAGEAEGTAAWEVEAYKGKSEVAVTVDAATGRATVK
jgi:hypothetical protein